MSDPHPDRESPPALSGDTIAAAIRLALAEDLGEAGDITSAATVPESGRASGVIAARQAGVLAGMPLAEAAFGAVDASIRFTAKRRDGDRIAAGEVAATVDGPARAILAAERVALNFLCHLSGIATATALLVTRVAHTRARILDTRKTTPGLRAIEKYAVRCGGGHNHRFGLHDAVLIKDNHIAVAGGVGEAVRKARAAVGASVKVEVEVGSLAQLEEAMSARADIVMLDNMSLGDMREAVGVVAGRAVTEASGNVTADTVAAIAETGVDTISSGWITHSAPALDLGLDFVSRTPAAAASERERSSRPRPRA
jgi:nicotinate-nucleotide pyrophosphorylase (carboxylating)